MHNDFCNNLLDSFYFLVILFVMSMMMMIISPNLMGILIGWDGWDLVSYCLVIYLQNFKSYSAGMLTILTNRIGDVAILISIAWFMNFGSWHFFFYTGVWDYWMNYFLLLIILVGGGMMLLFMFKILFPNKHINKCPAIMLAINRTASDPGRMMFLIDSMHAMNGLHCHNRTLLYVVASSRGQWFFSYLGGLPGMVSEESEETNALGWEMVDFLKLEYLEEIVWETVGILSSVSSV